jgi:hypothetical protein
MAVAKKTKTRVVAKRKPGRPAKTAARRGRPPAKAKGRVRAVAKPVKRLTRLQAAEIALNEALAEEARAYNAWEKAHGKADKARARVEAHKEREEAKRALIPTFEKPTPADDDGFFVAA